ncbi:MAG TPA: glycosyltransferase family 2 protein [Acidimicrobiales bacterium]|nr:glycosyltransferase family 2 protein [Acidimicrobiales bacterium]
MAQKATGRRQGAVPMVGIIVVNHNGGDLTLRCLRSLARTDWPPDGLRVVLVDNASSDGVVAQVSASHSDVTVLETGANIGFGGACNAGFDLLSDADFIGLVNNDARVEPGWLMPLVDVLENQPDVGAALPKILFDGAFVDVFLESEVRRRGRGDKRALGVRLSGVQIDGDDAWGSVQLVSGFWGLEHDPNDRSPFEWTDGAGHVRIPVPATGSLPSCRFKLSADDKCTVVIRSGHNRVEHIVSDEADLYDVPLGGEPLDVVNNVGSVLLADGHGADRGYLQPADENFTESEEVFAWCGAGVLLSRRYLDEVGGFDDRFFLYYEDLDLSWRGRALGWRHVYVPDAVVRHVHSATTVEGSALFDHYVERNRLLTLTRNAPASLAARAALRHVLVTGSYFRRDVVSPLARGAKPSLETVERRMRSFVDFARLLPDALGDRRRLRSVQRVPDVELMSWVRMPGRRVIEHSQ